MRRRGAAAYKSCAPTNEAGPPRFSTAVSRRAGVNDALVPRDVVDRSQSGKALASSTNHLGVSRQGLQVSIRRRGLGQIRSSRQETLTLDANEVRYHHYPSCSGTSPNRCVARRESRTLMLCGHGHADLASGWPPTMLRITSQTVGIAPRTDGIPRGPFDRQRRGACWPTFRGAAQHCRCSSKRP